MSSRPLHAAYQELDAASRHVLQIFALSNGSVNRTDVVKLSVKVGWANRNGSGLTLKDSGPIVQKLLQRKLLVDPYYGCLSVNGEVEDLVVQDAIRQDWFDKIVAAIDECTSRAYGLSYRTTRYARDVRVAFYGCKVPEFQTLHNATHRHEPVRLLHPFSRDIFDRLDPILQAMYLQDVATQLIVDPTCAEGVVTVFDELAEAQSAPSAELAGCWLDLAVARGDFESLRKLDERTGRKLSEIEGCEAFLRGDWDRAEQRLAEALPNSGQKTKRKSTVAATHLPSLMHLLLLFKRGAPDAMTLARSLLNIAVKKGKNKYAGAMAPIAAAIVFRQAPSHPANFAAQLKQSCSSPLATLIAAYFHRWLLTKDDAKVTIENLVPIAESYRSAGLAWLAAEAAGLAAHLTPDSGAGELQNYRDTHARLGTATLVTLLEPQPMWRRSLNAIAQLAEDQPPAANAAEPAAESERLIWELDSSEHSIGLQPFLQKRTSDGWSSGRRIGLQRLYSEWNSPQFAFLTEQDRAVCRTLVMHSVEGYRSYGEASFAFDGERVAHALVGHPRVYGCMDHLSPLEIVEQPPRLVVAKKDSRVIRLKFDPEPKMNYDGKALPFLRVDDGPRRIAFVFFNDQHRKLYGILGKALEVPAAAAEQVIDSIQKVASLVAVHSEIGGDLPTVETVDGDPRPHVHLLPFQGGLRAEFFVRPFGDDGPFCRRGQGGDNVFTSIGGQPKTARRDLAEEHRRFETLLEACPAVESQAEGDAVGFPSPVEALEALLQLEDQAAQNLVVLHWPQGQSMKLAGRASASQFQVQIRKDRDWFAASGTLKVDASLSVDMMQLIELVEGSSSRFVKLDDGRFLALTEQLRQRIEDLAAYGDRRDSKLRFPPVRAAALEDLGESVKLKADASWTACVKRMRKAGEVQAAVPTTLQAELRDYQREGFQWLARLAAWGVGGCLADDMGLGKTIEALALLLHRASGGPALVVAPTSVGFNWLNETNRFAPTLNARIFGPGDREAFFQDLGPRDVVICSYGLLYSEASRFQSQPWHTVIMDEAQAIKNMATRRSQAAMGLTADFRLIMTGTPLENHLGELWNLFQFINPGLLGSVEHFQKRFAAPIERDGCHEMRRRLKKLIQPFLLRRTKTQVLSELPPRTELTLQVELSREEAAFYEALRQRAIQKLSEPTDGRPQHIMILAEIMRLRRACCHPKLVLGDAGISSSKLALFSETIDELLDNHHKVLVFSQFVDHLAILREELDRKGVSYQYLDGSTPAAQRKQRVEAFQSGEGDVFLISLKAGGLGLNLTAADYVLHMDPWWNPAVEDQASDRAHRLGQQRPVTIYRFITQGTIEERITALHATKRDLADSLLEGAELSGKLSAEELLKLIRE